MAAIFNKMKDSFKLVRRIINKIIEVIVSVLNWTLLLIVYIVGIGSIAVCAKLFRKHFLPLKKEATTYWITKEKNNAVKTDYLRQF